MSAARKFKPFIRYGLKEVKFGPWQPNTTHEHQLEEVEEQSGTHTFIIDRCVKEGCTYERARDLITPKGGSNADDPQRTV